MGFFLRYEKDKLVQRRVNYRPVGQQRSGLRQAIERLTQFFELVFSKRKNSILGIQV
jgi:hypothetical protein